MRTHHLFDFHWLPVSYHVVFKLFFFFFKSLYNLPPSYLADSYRRPSRNLWSASQQLLEQPQKLTGTRLFQCVPLNCGTHYHHYQVTIFSQLKERTENISFYEIFNFKSTLLQNVFNICRSYTYTYRMNI